MSETVICYDIACPRRLGRIHRLLKKQAVPLQYSVFLFTGSQAELQRCLSALQAIMDPNKDDIRAYPLPQRGRRLCMGRATLPEGIYLGALPRPWQDNGTDTPCTAPTERASSIVPAQDVPPFVII